MKHQIFKKKNKAITRNCIVVFLISMLVFNLFVFTLKGTNQIFTSATVTFNLKQSSDQNEIQLRKLSLIEQENETTICENEEDEEDKETLIKSNNFLSTCISFSVFQATVFNNIATHLPSLLYNSNSTKIYLFLQVFRL
jgi:hypothetical protein